MPVCLVGIVVASTMVLAFWLAPSVGEINSPDRRLSAEGDLFAISAWVLVLIGTILALMAWLKSAQRHSLALEVRCVGDPEAFAAGGWTAKQVEGKPKGFLEVTDWALTTWVKNSGFVGARHPTVVISFEGCRLVTSDPAWTIPFSPASKVEWSGGADVVIYPKSTHQLPTLHGVLKLFGRQPLIEVELRVLGFHQMVQVLLPLNDHPPEGLFTILGN
jgi:hypothetical protein